MLMPLDISIQQKDAPLNYHNIADFKGDVKSHEDFELGLFLSGYLIDDVAAIAYRK